MKPHRRHLRTESISSASEGVAVSPGRGVLHLITTDGDQDANVVTLADGVAGDRHVFLIVVVGNANDDLEVTPANINGGDKVDFADPAVGDYCELVFQGANWFLLGTEGGSLA